MLRVRSVGRFVRVLRGIRIESRAQLAGVFGAQAAAHAGVGLLAAAGLGSGIGAAGVLRAALVFGGGVAAATFAATAVLLARYFAMASRDEVTGLATRAMFDAELRRAVARANRSQCGLLLIVGDLDGFKHVNDAHGHPAGDAVLRAVGGRLQRCAREGDVVGRDGGDEFILLMENVSGPREGRTVARRIRERVREPIFLEVRKARLRQSPRTEQVRVQVGVSLAVRFVRGPGLDAAALRKEVDDRLLAQKARRRRPAPARSAGGAGEAEAPAGAATDRGRDAAPKRRIGFTADVAPPPARAAEAEVRLPVSNDLTVGAPGPVSAPAR